MKFLYAAYLSTWVIHLSYVGVLLLRYVRLKHEFEELKK